MREGVRDTEEGKGARGDGEEREEVRGEDGPLNQIPGFASAAPRLYNTPSISFCVRP